MRPRGPAKRYRGMTPAKAEQIRREYFRERMKQKAIAERHGITQASVSRIVSGMVWRDPFQS